MMEKFTFKKKQYHRKTRSGPKFFSISLKPYIIQAGHVHCDYIPRLTSISRYFQA